MSVVNAPVRGPRPATPYDPVPAPAVILPPEDEAPPPSSDEPATQ